MKKGDLVELVGKTRFTGGETLPRGEVGVLVRREYLAYDPGYNRWLVMFPDDTLIVSEKRLKKIVK